MMKEVIKRIIAKIQIWCNLEKIIAFSQYIFIRYYYSNQTEDELMDIDIKTFENACDYVSYALYKVLEKMKFEDVNICEGICKSKSHFYCCYKRSVFIVDPACKQFGLNPYKFGNKRNYSKTELIDIDIFEQRFSDEYIQFVDRICDEIDKKELKGVIKNRNSLDAYVRTCQKLE